MRVHNMAIPLTNMKHLPFEYLDVTATAHYFARVALNRVILIFNQLLIVTNECQLYSLQRNGRNESD